MPANEQTWRDSKLLHVVFGISSIVMLVTTVWMMADDHNRPWKEYQRTFRNLDVQTTEWRATEQESDAYKNDLLEYEKKLAESQAKSTVGDRDLVDEFLKEFKEDETAFVALAASQKRSFPSLYDRDAAKQLSDAANALVGKDAETIRKGRSALLKAIDSDPFLKSLRFREDNLTAEVKDKKAYFSQAQSQFDQAVGRNESADRLEKLQKAADDARKQVESSTALMQKTIDERKSLEAIVKKITADEDEAKKKLAGQQDKVAQFEKAAKERKSNVGKSVLELPILDAFNSPLKIENRWLPQLPWNNNFRDVARFDRCETCHQGIERTLPGSAVAPAFPPITSLRVELKTPERPSGKKAPAKPEESNPDEAWYRNRLAEVYGLELADTGLFSANDVTISAVFPRTKAADAGLMGGDVIKAIDGAPMTRRSKAIEYLLAEEHWGKDKSLALSIQRGVEQPFATHPRLDLFVGSLSPHPVAKFGCTICHQGQGSATAFKWASHTPNNLVDAEKWARKHQWFNNENWTYPMYPDRFVESTCLKCHHEVVELERSNREPSSGNYEFHAPPAPKVVAGYEIIRRYGCFGCHEINGYDGKRRIGPDLRLEPNYSAAAAQLLIDPGLAKANKQAVKWAEAVEFNPNDDAARHNLVEMLDADIARAKPSDDPKAPMQKPILTADSRRMDAVLRDVENPGTERKVGPSLRHVASKLGFQFLTSWIENPQSFRPDTRMPRFFGQWDHLDGRGLAEAQRLEPIEVRAVTTYLLKASQPFQYIEPAGGGRSSSDSSKQERADKIARGKKSFQTRGCLACHQHADFKKQDIAQWQGLLDKVPAGLRDDDFPELKATQGPDLSRIGAKLVLSPKDEGRKWLYSWIRNPSQYHPRTFMPVLFLLEETDAAGKPTGIDPADDVTEYLMSSQQDWKPSNALTGKMNEAEEKALDELALAHLGAKFSVERAKDYLQDGIPTSQADMIQGEELALINSDRGAGENPKGDKETLEHKNARLARTLDYVGRRTISKYGCFGCHDIPGYEDSKTIGTALADWGRKLPARLAFEQIAEYLTHTPNGLHSLGIEVAKPAESSAGAAGSPTAGHSANHSETSGEPERVFSLNDVKDPDIAYFLEKLLGEEREGFIWQKLRAPRSYDYKKTENKLTFNDRLRMPKFHFATDEAQNQQKIEQVMTFVLGLVSEPPPAAFVYHPAPAKESLLAGRKVLEKFNCGGCHILEMERWDLEFKPDAFPKGQSVTADFPFVMPHFTPEEISKSKALDRSGMARSSIVGMPKVTVQGGPMVEDVEDEENPSAKPVSTATFMNFVPALIDGKERVVGKDMQVPLNAVTKRYPARGGDLARYALPVALKLDDATYATYKEKPNEAWGWLPPPLIGEGKKVQTDWVHDFLLDPFQIRPAAVLRMPKFNMSSAEATKLAAYFAAADGAEYPYEFDERNKSDYLERAELEHPRHLEGALSIIVDNNFCVKCHKVGDFSPTGTPRAMAPRLDRVHNRLRPEFTHRWIAEPAAILPYTGMPQNFPPPPAPPNPAATALYTGTSDDQINAVVDLLMNFDRFAQDQLSIKSLVKPTGPAPAAAGAAAANSKPAEDSIR
jgi:cytochrome c2